MIRLALAPLPIALLLVFVSSPSRAQEPAPEPEPRFEIAAADSGIAESIERDAREAAARVEAYFGAPFPRGFTVRVFPDRSSFDRHLREAWGMPETACWMVGGAEEEALVLLSPRVWDESACDHDPGDPAEVRDLIAHELVHVYHMQVNPTDEFDGVEGLDWFVEGLATLVSGQHRREHAGRARAAVEKGEVPETLDGAWTGPYRYGVSGSLVAFVAGRVGREGLVDLLGATSREEVLDRVGLDEAELLDAWEAWVRATR